MINADTVKKIAKLARIDVTGDEEHLSEDLSSIMGWIEQLDEADTDGVPAMSSVADMSLHMRPDKVTDGNTRESVLKNAPNQKFNCFAVPKVIE